MSITPDPHGPVLVIGATGSVGSAVVAALHEAGLPVRTLVRVPQRAIALPHAVQRHQGDLRRPEDLRAALLGVRAAFYVSPHEADEVALATGVVAACEQAGVRLVFAGVHVTGRPVQRLLGRAMFAVLLRHYRGKLRLARMIERCQADPVVLVPSNFMQNDELVRADILGGEFPQPLGRVNRVDLRDVAEAAVVALRDDTLPSGAYPLVGPRSLGGAECAAVWADVLGRPVAYTGGDPERWEAAFQRVLTGRKAEDFLASFRALGRLRVPTSPADVAATTRLLGHPPRSYEAYVEDTARTWVTV